MQPTLSALSVAMEGRRALHTFVIFLDIYYILYHLCRRFWLWFALVG